ncbi:bi-domain-containing oxidoreductase [Fontivita pretiosa]|uniref:bi-domain-containing oxidoreductase n=1 Tax=Fontivita pretiosa TaxID=2989684 RepID=UPI003D17C822
MKQILQSYRSGELWLAEVPAPALRAGGAIVQTAASLVSAGTERMIVTLARKSLVGKAMARPDLVRRIIRKIRAEGFTAAMDKALARLDAPIALGYSCAGTVIEVGQGVAGELQVGDRVACGGAGYATHAELNYVPRNLLARIPQNVSFEDASFTTVGAIAMQGVRQADVRLGECVVVIGLGLVGLLTVQILKAAGCRVLGCDLDAGRCSLARQCGADDAVGRERLRESAAAMSGGHGADAVIITAATASNQPIDDAAEICRVKGRVVVVGMVGMQIPREPFYRKELDLRLSMSYGPGRYDPHYEEGGQDYPIGYVRWTEQRNMSSFLELLSAGKVTPGRLITHRFGIDDAMRAYELLEHGSEPCLGMVINYPTHAAPTKAARAVELRPIRAIGRADRIGVGLIGAGNFARGVLIPHLLKLDGLELVGVCTATGMTATQAAQKFGFARATTEVSDLLEDRRIGAIFIATRHDSHARLVCQALAAGKHVFVEKPLCMTPQELEQIERAVEASPGVCLMVGFNRRFSPHTQAIRQAFASRGTPMMIGYRVNAGVAPRDSWLQDRSIGGGRIIGEVCHFVDWCEAVIGSTPVQVQAECIATDDARFNAQDNLVVTMRYGDGSVATIQYVSLGPGELPKERAEVFAAGGAAILDDFRLTTFYGIRRATVKTRQDKGFAGELSAFVTAVRDGGSPPIPLQSMARSTRVTFAIVQSLSTGRAAAIEPIDDAVADGSAQTPDTSQVADAIRASGLAGQSLG